MVPVVVTEGTGGVVADGANGTSSTTKAGSKGDSKCIHGSGIVELSSGATKRMADVAVGDRVRVGADEYSDVFMFTHKDDTARSSFVKVTTQSGHEIIVTPGHYLFAESGLMDSSDVNVGDMLVLGDGSASAAVSVVWIQDVGLYNPQTLEGSIVVNGVKVSTYTTAVKPAVAHTLLAPLRVAYSLFGLTVTSLERGVGPAFVRLLPRGPSFAPAV
jgi:hypothetical protein